LPFMSLSLGTLHSTAGSEVGIIQPSATPTITCFKESHSFQELTIVFLGGVLFFPLPP
jgi:hypothetical protein